MTVGTLELADRPSQSQPIGDDEEYVIPMDDNDGQS